MRHRIPAFVLAIFIGALVLGSALAHPTVVFGELASTPATPQAGERFVLTLTLRDPTQLGIQDAYVFAEFYPPEARESGEPIRSTFEESSSEGVYRTELSLPRAGAWRLKLRDQTYRQEETNAELVFQVTEGQNPAVLEFIFPPTQTPLETVMSWLLWLVGLPLLVGVIVTVMVLRGGKRAEAGAQG